MRWIFGTTTLVLLLAAGIGGAICFQQMVRLAAVPNLLRWSLLRRISVAALALSLLLMTLGTGLWGLFANMYAYAIFHARSGGLLNLSTFLSWLVSFMLFAGSTVVGFRAARLNCAASAP